MQPYTSLVFVLLRSSSLSIIIMSGHLQLTAHNDVPLNFLKFDLFHYYFVLFWHRLMIQWLHRYKPVIHLLNVSQEWKFCFVLLLQAEQQGPAYLTTGQFAPHALGRRGRPEAVQNARHQAYDMRMQHNKVRQVVNVWCWVSVRVWASGKLFSQVDGLKKVFELLKKVWRV